MLSLFLDMLLSLDVIDDIDHAVLSVEMDDIDDVIDFLEGREETINNLLRAMWCLLCAPYVYSWGAHLFVIRDTQSPWLGVLCVAGRCVYKNR